MKNTNYNFKKEKMAKKKNTLKHSSYFIRKKLKIISLERRLEILRNKSNPLLLQEQLYSRVEEQQKNQNLSHLNLSSSRLNLIGKKASVSIYPAEQEIKYKTRKLNKNDSLELLNQISSKGILSTITRQISGDKLNKELDKKKRKKLRFKSKKIFRKLKLGKKVKLIRLSYFNLTEYFPLKFNRLCHIFSNFFLKSVEFDLIRLHFPYNNPKILVNLLGFIINKIRVKLIIRKVLDKTLFKTMKKMLTYKTISSLSSSIKGKESNTVHKGLDKENENNINFNTMPAFLTGMKIRVAGRLKPQRIIPRMTTISNKTGSYSPGKVNFIDYARYTNRNKRGAYSITVYSSHNFY